jgi:4,5-dihydroxyphthalate decarboxylase
MSWSRPEAPTTASFFADLQGEETRYYQQFGIFPMMHTVAVKQEILDQNPWVARCLVDAYTKSKQIWYEWRNFTRGGSLPFARYALTEQAKVLGDDPFPFALEPNLKTLETVARYALTDRLITKPIADVSALWVQDVALDERVRSASPSI